MRTLSYLLLGIVLLCAIAVWQRFRILLPLSTTGAELPQVTNAVPTPGGKPFAPDNHFFVVQLDEETFAIAEPYSWARNVNYLILGSRRALLFDAGVGHYDIRGVVSALTDLPITFMPSHFHYDHTGQGEWARVALVDLPHIRARAKGNRLTLTWEEHLGSGEGIELPTFEVSEWISRNSTIDLGNRSLQLLYTPGHTDNSVSLLDIHREIMFTGDFLTNSGGMSAFLPTARLGDFLQSTERVMRKTKDMQNIVFRGAHAPETNTIPAYHAGDLENLHDKLLAIRSGELKPTGGYPVVYAIAPDLTLTTEPNLLQNWSPTYPNGLDNTRLQ